MTPLPRIMVAPNGARKTKSDHPALPVTIPEIVDTARACHAAGADALHAHVRDVQGAHVLDAGLYTELLAELAQQVPALRVQITTEAVGRYSPQEQRELVRAVQPAMVSVGLTEQNPDGEAPEARAFYHWAEEAGIQVQHILYSAQDLARYFALVAQGHIPPASNAAIFVLGRYTAGQVSTARDLDPFLDVQKTGHVLDWGVCAFGKAETDCLLYAHRHGGKMRIGFENNLHQSDGTLARDNAARVTELVQRLCDAG